MKLNDVIESYNKYLEINQNTQNIIKLTFATVVANIKIDDIPIWIILIGKAGSGKTTLTGGISKSNYVYTIDTLTPAGLMSSFHNDSNKSLLEKIKNKILLIKDFSTVTELNADMRNYLFSLLRASYDGDLKRITGKNEQEFEGKFGIIANATFAVETFKKLEGLLGERFLHIRMPENDVNEIFKKARQNVNKKSQMNKEIMDTCNEYINSLVEFKPDDNQKNIIKMTEDEHKAIEEFSKTIIKLRATVVRDSYTKEIIYPAETLEEPQRIYKQLLQIYTSLKYIDVHDGIQPDINTNLISIIGKIMMDSISYVRYRILKVIKSIHTLDLDVIAEKSKLSRSYVGRIIEEMKYIDIIKENIYDQRYDIVDSIVERML